MNFSVGKNERIVAFSVATIEWEKSIESANPLRRKGFRYFLMFREQNLNKRMNNSTLYSILIHITIRKKYDNRNMICIGNSPESELFLYCDGLRYGGTES